LPLRTREYTLCDMVVSVQHKQNCLALFLLAIATLRAQAQDGFLARTPAGASAGGTVVSDGSNAARGVDGVISDVGVPAPPATQQPAWTASETAPQAGAGIGSGFASGGGGGGGGGGTLPPLMDTSLSDGKTLIIVLLLLVLFCVVCVVPCCCIQEAYECLCGPGSWAGPQGCGGGYTGTEMAAAGLAGMAASEIMGGGPGYPGGYPGGGYGYSGPGYGW